MRGSGAEPHGLRGLGQSPKVFTSYQLFQKCQLFVGFVAFHQDSVFPFLRKIPYRSHAFKDHRRVDFDEAAGVGNPDLDFREKTGDFADYGIHTSRLFVAVVRFGKKGVHVVMAVDIHVVYETAAVECRTDFAGY